MKRKVSSVHVLGTLLVLGAVASGQTWAQQGLQVHEGYVGGFQIYSNGQGFQFNLVGTPNLCSMAGHTDWGEIFVDDPVTPPVTADGVKAILDSLKQAKINQYKVRVYAYDNTFDPQKGCHVEAIDFDSNDI
jgi:hypothetical protein